MLQQIMDHEEDSQIILTTHSNMIASRLNLRNVIWIAENHYLSLKNVESQTSAFFEKADDNEFLQLLLSKKVILVEGATEYLLLPKFYEKKTGRTVENDGISIISCNGISYKLGIQIQSARINAGTVIRPSNIQEILDDKNIVKLVYDNASHYSFRAVNWSYSKGDTYDAACVILNGSTEKLVEDKFSVSTLKTVTLNKLYVALTRSKGDLYIVTQDEFETVKEKYYK